MTWIFLDQRIPALLGLLATTLLGAAALLLGLPTATWGHLRLSLRMLSRSAGLVAGGISGSAVVVMGYGLGAHGLFVLLIWLIAALITLLLGVYLPGLEARRHGVRAQRLELQTIDFSGYMLSVLSSGQGDAAVLREYVRRPRAHVRDMQLLVSTALETHTRAGRGSVFDALDQEARASGCAALGEVVATIRQIAKQDRTLIVHGLTEQRRRLLEILVADATRRARQRETVVMLTSAGALFFGMLLLILYVMTGGGTLLILG